MHADFTFLGRAPRGSKVHQKKKGVAFEFSAGRNTVTYGFSRSLAGLWLRVFPAGSRLLRFLRRSCQICCECILAPESETENLMHDFWDASVDSAVRCNAKNLGFDVRFLGLPNYSADCHEILCVAENTGS